MKTRTLLTLLLLAVTLSVQSVNPPVGLRTDLMEHTDKLFINGNITQLPLDKVNIVEPYQIAYVGSEQPSLSWEMVDDRQSISQSAFQVELSSDASFQSLLWDSGKLLGDTPMTQYAGAPLSPSTIYYWRVKVWDNYGEQSEWSTTKIFRSAQELSDYAAGYYPLMQSEQSYTSQKSVAENTTLYDFEKAAFGRVKLTVDSSSKCDTLTLRFGEVMTPEGRIDREPGGSRRFREVQLPLMQGRHTYHVAIERDERNTREHAIAMPQYIGDVYPFRYCEVDNASSFNVEELRREVVTYQFNDYNSHFDSSNELLNEIWDFCKYSIKATSFAGLYVDGDRERIPYEADAYINLLCHYGVDNEYTMARRTNEYLIFSPTWPTEWILSCVLLSWSDYLYSGNADFIEHFFTDLEAKTLTSLLDDNGLISTRTGKLTTEVKESVHYRKKEVFRDIVDWPQKGGFGLTGDNSGETDGFEFTDYNSVVNAYFNKALTVMSQMARAVGEDEKSQKYAAMAAEHKVAFNKLFLDKKLGYYKDGIDTSHSSLHANMFALAFDLVPEKYVSSTTEFVKSRGMACSVYGSQHLLNAVYAGEDAEYGVELLTAKGDRGWYHAIYNVGTTITLEAWDNKYKPNQDWNHAWGAAPANIIPMQLMGIQPLTPGFGKALIKPQPYDVEWAEIRYPTIRGEISLSLKVEDSVSMELSIPANMSAEVWIPSQNRGVVMVNGERHKAKRVRNFYVIDTLGSGDYSISVE
ncbi:MAG: family 78 glycoside hydrolase catalytic domain [Rikenellaceae bacterium]